MNAEINRFENELRRRARQEVLASPVLLREFSVRREWWVYKALRIGYFATIPFGGVLLPLSLAFVFIGMGRFAGQAQFAGRGNSDVAALGLAATCYCGWILCTGAATVYRRLKQSPQLAVAVHFPMHEVELLREASIETFIGGAFFAYVAAYLFGYFAWQRGLTLNGWLAGLVVLALYVPVAWAITILFCVPTIRDSSGSIWSKTSSVAATLAIAATIGSLLVGAAGFMLGPATSLMGGASIAITPIGWINGIYCIAVLEHQPVGWLFLVPIGLLIETAIRRYRRGFEIREVAVESDGAIRAVFAGERAATVADIAAERSVEKSHDGAVATLKPPITAELLGAVFRASEPCRGRMFGGLWNRLISPRDEAVLEALRWPSRLTIRNWVRWSVGTITVCTACVGAIANGPPTKRLPTDLMITQSLTSFCALMLLIGIAAPSLVESARAKQRQRAGKASSLLPAESRVKSSAGVYAYYPVSCREITSVLVRSYGYILACWLPIALAVGVISAALTGISAADAILSDLVPGIWLLSGIGVVVCIKLSTATNDTRRLRIRIAWMAMAAIIMLSCGCLWFMPSSRWSLLALLVLNCSSWSLWRYYIPVYERGNVDIFR